MEVVYFYSYIFVFEQWHPSNHEPVATNPRTADGSDTLFPTPIHPQVSLVTFTASRKTSEHTVRGVREIPRPESGHPGHCVAAPGSTEAGNWPAFIASVFYSVRPFDSIPAYE